MQKEQASKKCTRLLKYFILFEANFTVMFTSPSPFIWYAGMTDDVIPDDSIIDYIIAKWQNYFRNASKGREFGYDLI